MLDPRQLARGTRGGNPFSQVNSFLKENGFKLCASSIGGGSTVDRWLNWWRTNARLAARERTLHPQRIYQGIFDVLYVNSVRHPARSQSCLHQ